jgi:hypothetical protein
MDSYSMKNKGYKYILTVIDNFSKYVFAVGLKNKTAETILEGMMDIIENQAEGTHPRMIQSDNGGEFKNKIFQDWAKLNKITLKLSMSYQPTSNALIENFNNLLRKMIREGFIRHNNLNWIDHLPNYLYNRNHSRHSTTKYTPDEVWRNGRDKLKRTADVTIKNVRENIINKAKKALDRFKVEEYKEGDTVRVLETSLYSNARKLLKADKKKLIVATYSPDLYKVAGVYETKGKDKEFVRPRYFLYDKYGDIVLTQLKRNNPNKSRGYKLFFASELQKITNKPKKLIDEDTVNEWNQDQVNYDEEQRQAEEEKPKVHQTRSKTKADATPPTKIHNTRSRLTR